MKYKIDACHTIFKRIIKRNLSFDEMKNLKKELEKAGYDSILIEEEKS